MTPLPKTYKAAVFEEKGKPLVIKDIELKKPEDGQILVKVIACGVCHSDTMAQNDGMGGGLPRIPGHEIIGDVVDVPSSETKWKVGDRVGGAWHGGIYSPDTLPANQSILLFPLANDSALD